MTRDLPQTDPAGPSGASDFPELGIAQVDRERLVHKLRHRDYEGALEMLYSARVDAPNAPELSRGIQLLKERLVIDYQRRLGTMDAVPVPSKGADPTDLPLAERQVFRLIDGIATYDDILSITTLGRFRTYQTLVKFAERGLVQSREPAETSLLDKMLVSQGRRRSSAPPIEEAAPDPAPAQAMTRQDDDTLAPMTTPMSRRPDEPLQRNERAPVRDPLVDEFPTDPKALEPEVDFTKTIPSAYERPRREAAQPIVERVTLNPRAAAATPSQRPGISERVRQAEHHRATPAVRTTPSQRAVPSNRPPSPDSFDALFDRATIAYLRKDFATCGRLVDECLSLRPDDPRALELQEKLATKLG